MCVREDNPFGSQLIHVRGVGLGIALQAPSPVVEIIDGNKQNVGFTVLAANVLSVDAFSCRE